tara:strand:+ start:120 stop:275 length:156 start_codon:yes stop_codon:yes gene_type:complete
MGLLSYIDNLINNYELKIQQLEQQLKIAQQTIHDIQKKNEPIREVVELEDK